MVASCVEQTSLPSSFFQTFASRSEHTRLLLDFKDLQRCCKKVSFSQVLEYVVLLQMFQEVSIDLWQRLEGVFNVLWQISGVFYGIIHPEAVNNSLQIADCPNTIQR
jgi:hypothetical protein